MGVAGRTELAVLKTIRASYFLPIPIVLDAELNHFPCFSLDVWKNILIFAGAYRGKIVHRR